MAAILGKDAFSLSPRTPGSSGHNDAGSPDTPDWFVGSTPGSTGVKDGGDPSLSPNLGLGVRLKTFPGLDVNPARGVMQRAQFLAQHGQGGNSGKESPATLFDKFVSVLDRIDKGMTGDATQSWGWLLWGEGESGKGSTAAKPTKDAIYLNAGGGDLKELFEIFDLLLLTMGDKIPGDVRKSLEAKKEEIFTTWQKAKEDPAKLVFEKVKEVKDIKETAEEERKKKERRKQTTAQLLGQFKALRKEAEKIDFKGGDAPAKPKPFTVPGKFDYWKANYTYYKMDSYYMKDKTGKKGLFRLYQTENMQVFEIYTDGSDLYPLSWWDKSAEDKYPPRPNGEHVYVTRYPAGCTYIYKGAAGLYGDLPLHP